MSTDENEKEQERKLEEMDYNPSDDIFTKLNPVRLDGDGNPITAEHRGEDGMPYGLDVPGAADDGSYEQVIDQLPADDGSSNHEPSQTANDLEPDSKEIARYDE